MTDTGASEDDESYVGRPEALETRRRELAERAGALMKATREASGLGQHECAALMGVRQPTMAGYEAATGGVLQIHVLEAFEKAVGADQGSMFDKLGLAPKGRPLSFDTFIMSLDQLNGEQKKAFLQLWRIFVPEGSEN